MSWAHELIHKVNREGTTRQQRELEAESVGFAVLAAHSWHPQRKSDPLSLASDVTAEMLTAFAPNHQPDTAKRIISTIDGNGKTTEDADENSGVPRAFDRNFALYRDVE